MIGYKSGFLEWVSHSQARMGRGFHYFVEKLHGQIVQQFKNNVSQRTLKCLANQMIISSTKTYYFDIQLIVKVIYQATMSNICWFQLHKCESNPIFCLYHCKFNIFWTVLVCKSDTISQLKLGN